jgi:hypothetical protein
VEKSQRSGRYPVVPAENTALRLSLKNAENADWWPESLNPALFTAKPARNFDQSV